MSNPRSIDSKREEFRKYLESSGLLDAITRILTMLKERNERDVDPIEFLRDNFERSSPSYYDWKLNQKSLEKMCEKVNYLEAENARLKDELAKYHNLPHSEK